MAMARPVVLTARPILHDYVDDGQTALVVPPEDPAALRGAIDRVLCDPGLATELGATGRARVEQGLTTRHFAAGIAPILRSAAAA
jgi:glycosyltransferase involved in cell wall biosynthesis